jgi:IPT/TIG domain
MTDGIAHVRPGDLIRADDFNTILDELKALDARVASLEGDGGGGGPDAVRITSITPSAPRVGDEMRITGANFGFSTGSARIAFDGTVVTAYKSGSSDNLMIFDVPEISGLPQAGRPMVLQVSNRTSSVIRTITLLPRSQPMAGHVDLVYRGPTPTTPTAGQPLALSFRMDSGATLPVTFTVSATVSVAAWQSQVQILDENGTALPFGRITVPARQRREFSVRLPIPTGTPAGTPFTVDVLANAPAMVLTVPTQSFTVGTAAPTPDGDIELNLRGSDPEGVLVGDTVTLAPSARADILVMAEFSRIGTFVIGLSTVTGWTISSNLPGNGQVEIESGDMGGDGKARRPISLFLTAPGASATTSTLTMSAQEAGTGKPPPRVLTLRLRTS